MSFNGVEYSSTQVDFDGWFKKELVSLANSVPDSMLAQDGRELDSHLTLLYGITGDSPECVRKAIESSNQFGILISGVSLFERDEYDVLKADIVSPGAHLLRGLIAAGTKYVDTFPTYCPHSTFAYLKKKRDKHEFAKMMDRFRGVAGMTFMAKDVTFSPPSPGVKTKIKLKVS